MEMMVPPELSLAPFWCTDLPGELRGASVIPNLNRDGREGVVFGDANGVVRAVRGTDASCFCRVAAASPMCAQPAIANIDGDSAARVATGTRTGDLLVLRGRGGEVLWRHAFDRAVRVKPALLQLRGGSRATRLPP